MRNTHDNHRLFHRGNQRQLLLLCGWTFSIVHLVQRTESVKRPPPSSTGAAGERASKRSAAAGAGGGTSFPHASPPAPKRGVEPTPSGAEDCLQGYRFVMTGVLQWLEREEAKHLIQVALQPKGAGANADVATWSPQES